MNLIVNVFNQIIQLIILNKHIINFIKECYHLTHSTLIHSINNNFIIIYRIRALQIKIQLFRIIILKKKHKFLIYYKKNHNLVF